jgi:acyl carrier protein
MNSKSIQTIEEGLLEWCNNRLRFSVPITAETNLLDSGYLDSLLVMDVVLSIEKQYGVAIDSSEISPRHFRSVKTLAALVASRNGYGNDENLNN